MRGAPTDIRSGMPVTEEAAIELESKRHAARLEERLSFLSVSESQASAELIAVVEGVLTERIAALIDFDPEAIACQKILKAIGGREIAARHAAAEYVKRFTKIKPGAHPVP
jgi:uncharacterized protein YdbL (DUF1318 family)